VGDDTISPAEGLRFHLRPLPGAHILDREGSEEDLPAGPEHPQDLGCHSPPTRLQEVTDDVDQEDCIKDPPMEWKACCISNNEAGSRRPQASPGTVDGMGGYIGCDHAPGLPDQGGEGLAVPAPEFQDGGASGEAREWRRCSTPEVPPPPVIAIPGISTAVHRLKGRCLR